jgi:phage anti-repressor protein
MLKNNFIEHEDYDIVSEEDLRVRVLKHPNENILIVSPDTFKSSLMMLRTDKSKTIRQYYLTLEKIFKDLFSEYDASLEALKALNIPFKEIKGTSATIGEIVAWFNNNTNERKVLFMNSQYCGAGLNLQVCTDIIIYHKMNNTLITQIIGRAQRVGRTHPLNVYSFDE